MILIAALAACRQPPPTGTTDDLRPAEPDVSPVQAEKLRVDLIVFADHFAASVAGTADQIADLTTDRQVLEHTLLWKLRVIPTLQKVARSEDPRRGLFDTWAICVQMRRQLARGTDEFGEHQHLALDTAQQLEARVEAIGAQFVPAADIAKAKKEIEKFAEGYPVSDKFASSMIRASQIPTSSFNRFTDVLSIPVSGLADSASAIDRFARVAAACTEILQEIPEHTRWQTELLLFKTEQLRAVTEALGEFGEVSRNFETIAQTTKALPTELRKELTAFVESTDATQTRLGKTVHEAVELTANLTSAGAAWEATAKSVHSVVEKINEMADATDTDDAGGGGDSFDVAEYTRAAEAIRSGATEVRSLLADIESGRLAAAGSTADASIDRAADRSEALVDRITICAAILIGFFFGALLAYRRTMSKWPVRHPDGSSEPQQSVN